MSSIALPIAVWSYLRRFESRRRYQELVRALGRTIAVTLVWGLSWCLVDRVVGLPNLARAAALAVNVGVAGALLSGPVGSLFRRRDAARVAREAEDREPGFGQKLETVVSRASGPAGWRGSEQLLAVLAEEVSRDVATRNPGERLPWARVMREWTGAVVLIVSVMVMARWSWLDLPTLGRRYAMPMANVSAVTTTRLLVLPGDVSVAEGETLRVRVLVDRLGDASPVLHVRSDGVAGGDGGWSGGWSEQTMSATPDGAYEARLRNVDRDVEYFVNGGDARSEVFSGTVLHKPAIAKFRVHFSYPAYMGLANRDVESAEGDIEAPVGTEATVTIDTTEPLGLAMMTIGGEGLRMSAGDRANVQQVTFTVRQDKRFAIRMASLHGVIGAFRGGTIRAIADRPPVVKLRGGELIRAAEGSVVPIGYLAADDYGLARLDAELFVARGIGGTERRSVAIMNARGRAAQGEFNLDLKALGAREGDEIEVRLRGEDRAGQLELTDAVRVSVVARGAEGPTVTPPANAPATTQRAADAPALDPPGFGDSLRAYFEAMRRMREP